MQTPFQSHEVMSFTSHLDELRSRLIRCLWIFLGGFFACYWIADSLLEILRRPLFALLPEEQRHLYFTHLFENFFTHLKIAGYASCFFFAPLYFYQLWAFIAPGLYPREKKWVIPFLLATTLFFLGGASFAYFVLFPIGFHYFLHYGGPSDIPLLTMDAYYGTCVKLLFLFGLAFELPVLICCLGFLGVVDAATLRQQRRNAIIGISVLSALFAPPDAISMILLGGPLVLLYEAALLCVDWFGKRSGHTDAQTPADATTSRTPDPDSEPDFDPFLGKSR